jgi:hypothetical protein
MYNLRHAPHWDFFSFGKTEVSSQPGQRTAPPWWVTDPRREETEDHTEVKCELKSVYCERENGPEQINCSHINKEKVHAVQ